MKWSALFGSCLLLSASCVQTRTQVPPSGPSAPYVLLFPELLRDPKDDVRDLMLGALRDLDHDLGGGVLEVHTVSEPMLCWEGQRSIPRALCHSEAQGRIRTNGEEALVWGYAVNAGAKVFLLFLSARDAARPVQLEPSGQDGQLTRRDLLGWFREAVLSNLRGGSTSVAKARLLRDRLLTQGENVASNATTRPPGGSRGGRVPPISALWAAELAHFAGDISWSLAVQSGELGELLHARNAYITATGYYPEKKDAAWLNAEVGLAMSELRIGDQQKSVALLLSSERHFAAAHALLPRASPVAAIELGRGQALLLAGELERDPKRLWEAVSTLESSRAATQNEKDSSHSATERSDSELICRAALGAATLDVAYATRGRRACERALGDQWLDTDSCKSALNAKGHAALGQLLFLEAQTKADFEQLERVPPELECARTFPLFSNTRRTTLTHMLAQSQQKLGIQKRDAARLKQASALYRSLLAPTLPSPNQREDELEANAPEPVEIHQQLGLTLAFLGRLEPTALTLTEALAELQLAFPRERPMPVATLQAQLRAQLQLAGLSGNNELTAEPRAALVEASKQLTFASDPELVLDNALLSAFVTWQLPQSTPNELREAQELAQVSVERASLLFPEQAGAFQVLSLLLRLREASTRHAKNALCEPLQAADVFLTTPSPSLPAVKLWPNPKRLDLSRYLAELKSDAKLARACQNAPIPTLAKP